jgi:hypothetical protein
MVALLPALTMWAVGLFTAFHFLNPRLPKYSFRIHALVPKWVNKRFGAKLEAGIKLQNDNYMHIDIHALSFDLFYPDWKGSLNHIGNVQDKHQQQQLQQQEQLQVQSQQHRPGAVITETLLKSSPPLWAMKPRAAFETNDEVLLQPAGGIGVMTSLSWDIVKHWGTVMVPSSGVIHVKANSRIPLTLSILCDNELQTWSMEMQGVTCELQSLDLGWIDLPEAVLKLRDEVTGTLPPPQNNNNINDNNNDDQDKIALSKLLVEGKKSVLSFEKEYAKLTRKHHWKQAISVFGFGDKFPKAIAA